MSFLSGPRLEIIYEYISHKKFKNKLVIPIGKQDLKLKSIDHTVSKNGNEMVVLTIWKAPEEIDDAKRSFHTLKQYYTQYRIEQLKEFISQAFGYAVTSNDLQSISTEIEQLKSREFKCVVRHQKRLMMEDGKPIEKLSIKDEEIGLLMIAYEPVLWRVGTHDLTIDEHKLLIINFKGNEKEIFNQKLKERFNNLYE